MTTMPDAGVDVNKLCPHANPLVHYYRLGARGIVPVFITSLLWVAILGSFGFWLFTMAEAPKPPWGNIVPIIKLTAAPRSLVTAGELFAAVLFVMTLFQVIVFRLLRRDPRRDEGIVHLVLTPLSPAQIVWGTLRAPILATVPLMVALAALTLGRIEATIELANTGWDEVDASISDMIPSFLLVILFSTFRNTKAFTVGGLRGLEFALTTPVFALGIFGFGSAILRSEHTSHSSASALIGLLAVPSRLILSTLGLFALVYVARRAVHGELLPQFMKGAHPEHSVRNYWFARELEAKSTHRDVLISGRKRLSKIIGRDRIADFLVVIASQLGSIVAMQSMYSKSDLTEFFRGSFLLSFACIFSTCCVVLRRLYLPPRPGLPVVSGDLRGSLRRWYTPIACAQIVAAAIPVILAGVDFVDIGEYVISVFTGMLLGYVMLLSLIPRATRRATMRATARVICALVVTVFVTGYADFWILGEVKRGSYHMFPGEAPTGPDLFYYTGFVLRAFAWFFAIALVMDLRGLLLQRIHESEVLNHPIGALSTDPLPSAPTPPA